MPSRSARLFHQVHHAGADRDVQHRSRLVRHHEDRLDHQRPRNRHALPLSARQFVGKPEQIGRGRRQPHHFQHSRHPIQALERLAGVLHLQRLGHGVEDRPPRVQRLIRVLKNHLRLAPKRLQRLSAQRRDVGRRPRAVVEQHPPVRRLGQTHQQSPGRRLPAARLARPARKLSPRARSNEIPSTACT